LSFFVHDEHFHVDGAEKGIISPYNAEIISCLIESSKSSFHVCSVKTELTETSDFWRKKLNWFRISALGLWMPDLSKINSKYV
jgi:hypothetical protein